jgi:hypothetical protein
MALMNCPECTKEISDKSTACIHCGYPIEKTPANAAQSDEFVSASNQVQTPAGQKQVTSKTRWLYAVLGLVVLLIVGTIVIATDVPCSYAVHVFVNDVRTVKNRAEGLRDTMQKYKNMEFLSIRELDIIVPAIFRELEIREVPTCRTEPAKIVSALYRVRDAAVPAFIVMSRTGSSQTVKSIRELDIRLKIVNSELAQVDALLNAMEGQQAPAKQQAEAPVDACTAAVRVFASEVRSVTFRAEGMRDRMQKYIDLTHTERELDVPVQSAFRDLEILEVPTCRSEPAKIVSALYRVRDAAVPTFIMMRTAPGYGSSRETALRELKVQMPIVVRELAQVDAWLKAIE